MLQNGAELVPLMSDSAGLSHAKHAWAGVAEAAIGDMQAQVLSSIPQLPAANIMTVSPTLRRHYSLLSIEEAQGGWMQKFAQIWLIH